MPGEIFRRSLMTFSLLLLMASEASAQQGVNLVKNPGGDEGARYWKTEGKAEVEESTGSFLIRDGGLFNQSIPLPRGTAGRYLVVTGRAASERVNLDGATTGLPALRGYLYAPTGNGGGGRIYANLTGQQMLSSSKLENEWVKLWGVFRVPPGAKRIQLFLEQALQNGVPYNGSAARFDDLGIYIFETENEARSFLGLTTSDAAGSKATAENPARKAACALTLEESPPIDGLTLGMSMEQVSALLPVTDEEKMMSERAMSSLYSKTVGLRSLTVRPAGDGFHSAFGDAAQYSLRFLDGRLYHLHLLLNNTEASDVDELMRRWAGILNLPPPDQWELIESQNSKERSRYLICNGFEIRVFSAPWEKASFIWLVNNRAEKTVQERGAKILRDNGGR